MSTSHTKPNIYQLSGLDDRERGFTRQVECSQHEHEYRAVLRYERVKVEERSPTNEPAALQNLVKTLQAKGYTQMRSQLIFRGAHYLGSQEVWIDYQDAEGTEAPKLTVMERFRRWLKSRASHDDTLRHC